MADEGMGRRLFVGETGRIDRVGLCRTVRVMSRWSTWVVSACVDRLIFILRFVSGVSPPPLSQEPSSNLPHSALGSLNPRRLYEA